MRNFHLFFFLVIFLNGCIANNLTDANQIGTQAAATMISKLVQTQEAEIVSGTSKQEIQSQENPIKESTPFPESTQSTNTNNKAIKLTGKGSDVVDIEIPYDLAIAHIKGNESGQYFSITSYDKNGNRLDLLVNETEDFDGIVPINFNGKQISRLAIEGKGDWSIEISPIADAKGLQIPGKIEGKGNDVLVLKGGAPDLAHIIGNNESAYFSVSGFDNSGKLMNFLVNETEPYDGKVIVDKDISILVINSSGYWSIEIKIK